MSTLTISSAVGVMSAGYGRDDTEINLPGEPLVTLMSLVAEPVTFSERLMMIGMGFKLAGSVSE